MRAPPILQSRVAIVGAAFEWTSVQRHPPPTFNSPCLQLRSCCSLLLQIIKSALARDLCSIALFVSVSRNISIYDNMCTYV